MITYYKSYYWLIRLRYFAYTVSPSHWTYPNSGRYSLMPAVQNICSMHSSSWYAKCYMPHVIDSPRSIELEKLPRFRVLSTGSFAPIIKWSTRPMPHDLFALPAAWERTCHFKHCSNAIFTSNTLYSYMSLSLPANISLRFCKHWLIHVLKIRQHIIVHLS